VRQLQIVLRPEYLGTISVTLRLEGKRLLVTIEAEKPDTVNAMRHDKTILDGIIQGIAADAASVTITVRDAGTAINGQQPDASASGYSTNAGTANHGGGAKSSPGKPPGAKPLQIEELPHEKHQHIDSLRLGVVVI
jgi:hypothetical protein